MSLNDSFSSSLDQPETQVSLTENESLNIRISDAGIYSLYGLPSLLFHQLYSEESNCEFCKDTVAALLNHFGLSSNQVRDSMFALLEGEGGHPESINDFIKLLKNEELLKSSYVPLIEALVLFAIRDGCYDARIRVLILKIAHLFNIPQPLVEFHKKSVIEMLSNDVPAESEEQLKEKVERLRNKKINKYLLIGSGTLLGGAILGLTGDLAAPYVAIGASTLIGAESASALGSTIGIAIIGSLFGVLGSGLTRHKMAKREGKIKEFAFEALNEEVKEVHITIAVSGLLSAFES